MQTIEIEVSRNGERATRSFRLPVRIGRGAENEIRIGHDPEDRSISRTHAVIEESGGRITITDKSTNGMSLNGSRMKSGQATELASGGRFEIGQHKFKVSVPEASRGAGGEFFVKVGEGKNAKRFEIGKQTLGAFKDGNRIVFERGEHIDANSGPGQLLGTISTGGKFGVLTTYGERGVKLNNAECPPDKSFHLHALDVVNFHGIAADILVKNSKATRCHNCELLNAHDWHGNCRWCGHRLTEHLGTVILR